MQFDGPGVASLSMDDRMTVANMAIEAGGKNGIFPFDSRTAEWRGCARETERNDFRYEPVEADKTRSSFTNVVDLSKLEPTVACHPDPGQRKKAKEMSNVKLDRAYVGLCTGGKTSDFVEFACVLRGKGSRLIPRRARDARYRSRVADHALTKRSGRSSWTPACA